MARYTKQIEATRAAHMASRALSDAALVNLDKAWDAYTSGEITINAYAVEARKIVRFSYREAAAVARSLTMQQSEIMDWEPTGELKDTPYLKALLADVDRNLNEYRDGPQDEKDRRKFKLKVGLSAITAAERGFTDSQLVYYGELRDMGHRVSKLWLANFLNNEPCIDCVHLNGTEVDFDDEFPVPTLMRTAVYRDLQGPPLHVRCKCVMVVLVTRADNLFDRIPTSNIAIPATMSTETVKRLPRRIFDSIVKLLRAISGGVGK